MQTKMYALLVALLASVSFVGCTSDDEATEGGALKQLSFSAVADAGSRPSYASERMKTQLHPNEGNSVTFNAGDAISVFSDGTNNKFTTADSGPSVEFNGKATQTANYYALYPYQEGASISGSTVSAVLPTTQYAQAGTTFDPAAVLSVATTTSEEMNFDFKNVCGLVKFTTTEALAKVVFKGNSEEAVAGNVSITVGNAPTYSGADATSITLLPLSLATTFEAGTYYISVLPQAFEDGFTLEAYKSVSSTKADYALEISTNVEVERSQILNVGEMAPDYVDLGIEVDGYKVLWATTNVGATTPEGYGDYFAWGETTPKTNYSWDNYAWGTSSVLTKYTATDGKTVLELADDAARQNWGGDWVMPTTAEWKALSDNTTNTWTTDYNGTDVAGRVFTSKKDPSKSIFIPAAGYFSGSSVSNVGSLGHYWSASLNTGSPAYAYYLYFRSDGVSPASSYYRFYGRSVRPVLRMAIK